MKASVYVEQLRTLGESVHLHEGVWWRLRGPLYWKPAIELREFQPGSARPAWWRSLVGFSHLVPPGSRTNHTVRIMLYAPSPESPFSLEALNKKKRNQVRKGLRCCRVLRIDDIDRYFTNLKEINVSARRRTGVGLPETYYTERESDWRKRMTRLFALPERDWWGAFVGEKLVGYYYTYAVEETLFIDTAKVHSEALQLNAADALLFTLMENGLTRLGCSRIAYGDWTPDDQKLTEFKAKHGFNPHPFQGFRWLSLPARLALRLQGKDRRWSG